MEPSHQALWERIDDFKFESTKQPLTFAKRLARENGWHLEYANRVIDEYKRFMFLAVVADHPVTPSDQVDQAWHLHLTYTRSYWEQFCGEVLKTEVHHGPTKGGQKESEKFDDWYSNTKNSYEAFFGKQPPQDIWPSAEIRFGQDVHFQRINTRRNWIIPRPRNHWFWKTTPVMALAGSTLLFARGNDNFIVGVITVAIAIAIVVVFALLQHGGSNDSGCGSTHWGAHDDGSSCGADDGGGGDGGCGAGCGSGCGGCGGCGS